jgi:enamine deaminase RidA (YjgF/YER057c/UK114 family)
MALEAGLQVQYLPLAAEPAARWDDVLGVASFAGPARSQAPVRGQAPAAFPVEAIPFAEVRTPILGSAAGGLCEIWRSHQPLESGHRWRVHYRRGTDILFGSITVDEAQGLHTATADAYREVFGTLDELAYPYLLRIWNYLPQINIEAAGSERYWQFNSGRRSALLASHRDVAVNVPAACALGSVPDSPLAIYFLACREPPTLIENPRQVKAYEYPDQYGPRPAFSRAAIMRESAGAMLFISGTASIVGHRTLHVGDVAAQTREILLNIEALLDESNRALSQPHDHRRFTFENLAYKVYVRDRADLPLIQAELARTLGTAPQILYLQADVCRPDLLVEVEAVGRDSACD